MSVDIIATGVGVIGLPSALVSVTPNIKASGLGIIGESTSLVTIAPVANVVGIGIVGIPSALVSVTPIIRTSGHGIIGAPQSYVYPMQPINGLFNAIVTEVAGLGTLPFAEGVFEAPLTFGGYGSNIHAGIGSFESPIRQTMKGTGVSLGNSWLAWFKAFNEV